MQYKVPQNVQREDQILWFITLRQLIMLMIGFGISYILFVNFAKDKDDVSFIKMILIWIPAAISVAFAFLKIKTIPLFQFLLLLMEQTFFRTPRRYWIQGSGDTFISMTTRISPLKKRLEAPEKKDVSHEKIKNLASFLDNQKSNFDSDKK